MTTESALPPLATKPQARSHPTRRRPRWLSSIGKHAGLTALSLLMIYPLVWLVVSSFKPNDQIFRDLSIFTTNLTLDNYINGWNDLQFPFGLFLANSTIISVGAIAGNLLSCSLAAYAFARLRFTGRPILFVIMLMTIMLPFQVVLVPQFTIFKELGWLNTFLPLIVPKFLATDAFFVFLMVQFLRGLPTELDQAAKIDGAGPWQTYRMVILPLTVPALATTAIFTFIWTWNDFLTPMLYLQDPRNYTVPLGLNAFLDASGESAWGPMFAMAVLSLGPLFGFFLAGQKYLTTGIATTGLKG
jgi:multiple sugar transport system permease protein